MSRMYWLFREKLLSWYSVCSLVPYKRSAKATNGE